MGLVEGGNGSASDSMLAPVGMLLFELMFINIVLAVFNLIPIPPLDRSTCCGISYRSPCGWYTTALESSDCWR